MSTDPAYAPFATMPAAGCIDLGLTRAKFFDQYFERDYLLLRGALRERVAWSDVDSLLYFVDPTPPYFKLFKDRELPAEEFVDEHEIPPRLSKTKFYECLRGGATAVINRAERSWLTGQRLCNAVGRFCGMQTIGNAYLTYGGRGTFGKHWDTHDVFAVQLLGKKRWRVYRPTLPLPLSHHTSTAHQAECPTEPVLDIVLNEGDVLYLPRGWWHEAIPCDGGSFHLSVGTYAPTALDFVKWACAALEGEVTARAGLTGDPNQRLDVDALLQLLGKALKTPNALGAFHSSLADQERTRGEFDLQALVSPADALADSTVFGLSSRHAARFDGQHLMLNGTLLRLEPLRRALVQLLVEPRTLRTIYMSIPTAPRPAVRAALLDLAQHDIVEIRRP